MSLVLEIEYLTGVVFAAQGPDSDAPDWPPQPDRIFSALVATWGIRGEQNAEAEALKWLERQCAPQIAASEAEPRTAPVSFVPPNDPKAGRLGNKEVLPVFRRRQPRRFPAARPYCAIVQLYWEGADPDAGTFAALDRLASDTAYLGHSASLARFRFLRSTAEPPEGLQEPQRSVYDGRFAELCRDYKRLVESGGKIGRPRPGARVGRPREAADKTTHTCFSPKWLVLEHIDGEMPDIRAAAIVAKEIRDAVLSGYRQCGLEAQIPPSVSGHEPDGSATRDPHLAIVPLAVAGFPFADGHLLGFALVPPSGSGLLEDRDFFRVEDRDFLRALRKIAPPISDVEGRRAIHLRRFNLKLSPTLDPARRSLDPTLYTKVAQTFATVTPIVLDRHLKKSGAAREEELIAQIRSACCNIGLPEPVAVIPDKHSAMEGAPSALPSGNSPEWMRWRLPASLASRALTHAVLRFSKPVQGPLILGAGRFVGLGLCRPIAGEAGTE